MRLGVASSSPCFRAWSSPLCSRAKSIHLGRFDLTTFLARSRQREQVVARSGRPRSTSELDGFAREVGVATRPGARTPLARQSRGIPIAGVG